MFTSFRRIILFIASLVLLAGALIVVSWQSQHSDWRNYQRAYFERTGQPADIHMREVTSPMTGQAELCLSCHIGLAEISPSHPVETFGCLSCHGGNGLSLKADQAHEGLSKNPADLSLVQENCGRGCHSESSDADKNHVEGVLRNLQGTYAGGIAAVRFAFGAQPNEKPIYGVYRVADDIVSSANGLDELAAFPGHSEHPIDRQLAENCLETGCHLSEAPRPEAYFYRSTGCAACHIIYDNDSLYRGDDPTIPRDQPGHMRRHQLSTAIPFYQCNHCHNRGNYSLRRMAFLLRQDITPAGSPISDLMPAEGRRLIEYYQPIGQFTLCEWELDCIDCHTAQEVMGDGDIHPNQQEMQYTQCQTCHGDIEQLPNVALVTKENQSALRQARLNPNYDLQIGEPVIITKRDELMGHIKLIEDNFILTSKVTGKTYPLNPVMGSGCQQKLEEQESPYCHKCHAYER